MFRITWEEMKEQLSVEYLPVLYLAQSHYGNFLDQGDSIKQWN